MKDEDKAKEQLINELVDLRQRITELQTCLDSRMLAEKALNRYRQLVENLHEGIWVIDKDAYTTFVNPRMAEMLGYTVDEMQGKDLFSFLMDERSVEICKRDLERRKQGIKEQCDFEFLRKDGTRVYTSMETAPITDDDGNYIGALAAVTDITERKRAEAALRQKSEEQKALLSTIPAFVYLKDRNCTYIAANKAFADLTGTPVDEIAGKTDYDFFPKDEADFYRKCDQEVIESGEPKCNIEEPATGADGKKIWSSTSKIPFFDSDGNVIGMVGISLDITERKQAEEQIKASLREKEILLREIHHRVKNNLQVISSLLYLQSGYIKDKEALMMFVESQNRIKSMALVHEKLYQSKDLGKIDLAEYIRDLTTDLFSSYGVKPDGIKLKINVQNVLQGVNTAIPCGLIINELVSNSLKHAFPSGKEGEIRIDLRLDNDNKFTLTVSDNGVGFPKDLDFRNTETMGLQLVITLVKQLKGTIELDRGDRTEFKISFAELKYKERAKNGIFKISS